MAYMCYVLCIAGEGAMVAQELGAVRVLRLVFLFPAVALGARYPR